MMSKERELLKQSIEMIKIVPMMSSIGNVPPDFASELILEIQELLAQPEQEPFAYVADSSVGFDVSHSVQGMPLLWLGKLEYGDKLYRVRAKDE
jgi:hypothetical protein